MILECDSSKLAAQSISMADELRSVVELFAPHVKIEVVKTTTEETLKLQFAALAEHENRFGMIAVVGHGNADGIRLTSDRGVSWSAFANWVKIFEPKRMILIACQSGQETSARQMFAGIHTLNEVYASPVNISMPQSQIINVLIPYLLRTKTADADLIQIGQFFNFFVTRGIIFRWSRKEFQIRKSRT